MIDLTPQFFLEIDGTLLEFRWIEARVAHLPTLVFLHEGLGCVGMWKDFPDQIAASTACGVLIYSRAGYGQSAPAELPHPVRYMHHEGLVVLPEILKKLGLEKTILVGHSDGGSISLICAGSGNADTVSGLILMAPHVFNEQICLEGVRIAEKAYRTTNLPEKLARYHGEHTDDTFWGWHDVWLHPDFWHWNIEDYLPAIEVPVLVIQGEADQYGTPQQVTAIQTQISAPCTTLLLPDCGHAPHQDQTATVRTAIQDFMDTRFKS